MVLLKWMKKFSVLNLGLFLGIDLCLDYSSDLEKCRISCSTINVVISSAHPSARRPPPSHTQLKPFQVVERFLRWLSEDMTCDVQAYYVLMHFVTSLITFRILPYKS